MCHAPKNRIRRWSEPHICLRDIKGPVDPPVVVTFNAVLRRPVTKDHGPAVRSGVDAERRIEVCGGCEGVPRGALRILISVTPRCR